jgi:DNA-binding transcriptional LysR family regulator
MDDLKLEWLHTFAMVAALGSFSRAAARLGVTQPAVSQQVRRLETLLGVRLVERIGRRATPTPAGQELVEHCRRVDEAVAGARQAMARHAHGALGRVRIGTGATACIYLLPPVLQDLKRRFPSLEIMVRTGNTADVLKDLEDNALDVGLVTLPAAGRMFDVTPVFEDAYVAIAAAHANPLSEVVTPESLADLPVLLFEAGGNTRLRVDQWFARAGVGITPVMSLGNVEAIKRLVAAGLGCAVLPGSAVSGPEGKVKDGDGPDGIRPGGIGRDADNGLAVRPLAPALVRQLALVLRRDKILDKGLRETVKTLRTLHAPGSLNTLE